MMIKKIVLFFVFSTVLSCQTEKTPLQAVQHYQYKQNLAFGTQESSILTSEDFKNFNGLQFFPIDLNFQVQAVFTAIHDAPVFEIPTTTGRKPLYKKYGLLTFELNRIKHQLYLYQNQDKDRDPAYKDYLFLPFTDESNGEQTYGGGRFIDLYTTDITAENTVTIDFNKAYNPYCAYNPKYSCPIVPEENHLAIAVTAGVKDFKNSEKPTKD